jgi:hypothetical protein
MLRADEAFRGFRLLSIHNPEKKESTISAIADAAIFGFSASMFMERRRCSNPRFSITAPYASAGRIANSRMELTEKHPCFSPLLRGPFLRNVSTFFQPRGSLIRSPLLPWLSR